MQQVRTIGSRQIPNLSGERFAKYKICQIFPLYGKYYYCICVIVAGEQHSQWMLLNVHLAVSNNDAGSPL